MPREAPFTFNAAAEVQRKTQLDIAGLERFTPSARSLSYPVVMRGSTTNPTLNATPANTWMRYVRMNNVVTAWFSMTFTSAGSGTYALDLPVGGVAGYLSQHPLGRFVFINSGTGAAWEGWVKASNGVSAPGVATFLYLPSQGGAITSLSSTAPVAVGASSTIMGSVTYEAADGYTGP